MGSDVASRFGRNLVAARKRAGISQEELSFRAALHRTEIGLLERAERVPRIDTLAKLAGALGVRPEDLLAGIRWHPGDYSPGGFEERGGGEEQ
ncbi:MAG TPA: helix-turn-helix transcriptional regulator [Solirubrobacterales bacterium]